MVDYGRFLKAFTLCSMAYLGLNFVTIYWVDPYGIRTKGGRIYNDQIVKAIKVNRLKPDMILLGSSGIVRGINPNNEVFNEYSSVYNLGILGANVYELNRYFHHAVNAGNVDGTLMALDFYGFNKHRKVRPTFWGARLNSSRITIKDFLGLYFSLDALSLIVNQAERGPYFNEDGTFVEVIAPDQRVEEFEIELQEDFSEAEKMYWNYSLSEDRIEDFSSIVRTARKKGIDLNVFITPVHVSLFYAAMYSTHWPEYSQWLREIVKVQPVWDFSGCNSITTEPIKAEMENFSDPSHYTPAIGHLILQQIFTDNTRSIPTDFGVYVTPDNVDSHLNNVAAKCQDWESNHPQVVQWIRNLNLTETSPLSYAPEDSHRAQ